MNSGANWTDVVQALMSFLNLLFVFAIFFYEKRESKSSREKEKREYWYREIVLNRGISGVEEGLLKLEEDLHKAEEVCNQAYGTGDDSEVAACVQIISNDIRLLKRIIDASIPLFDKDFHNKLKRSIENLEDELLGEIEGRYWEPESFDPIFQKVTTYKYELYQKLYRFDMNILDDNTKSN